MTRVLLIDDDPLIRMALEWLMGDWGFQVVAAASEDEATNMLAENAIPALMVVDWRLPGGRTGADAVARIRDRFRRHIPAIVVTGEISTGLMHDIEDTGCPVLQKPVSPEVLKAVVDDVLSGARERASPDGKAEP